jgi:hypothetical protein
MGQSNESRNGTNPEDRLLASGQSGITTEANGIRQKLTPFELQQVENLEKRLGRQMTEQELNLEVEQFHSVIGEL